MTMTSGSGTYIGYEPPTSKPAPLGSKPPRRKRGGWIAILAAALVIGAVSGASAALLIDNEPAAPVVVEVATPTEPATPSETNILTALTIDPAAVGVTVIPSIVTVQVGSIQNGQFLPTASGSGVVFDPSHIITNNHVVDGSTAVKVVLSDGRVYDATIVGTDPVTDVAVLEVETADLEPLALGSTDNLIVGMPAIAVGSPLGLDGGPSLSVGVISALGREVRTGPDVVLFGMIQTDAPITNGSSGGALVDSGGELIGITTAVGASQLGIEGIGFATPIEIVERVATEIIETGSASHALLGILGSTAYQPIAESGVMPVGVTVDEVTESSSASGAGIAVGEVITSVDGAPVRTMDELITALRRHSAGDTVTIEIADRGTVTLQLGAR
ncbi:MAG: trypsin-like peptidase domain-containing protein [Acidimicrobiia bacterium]|nr:MAG: trypsin-like peptidase domain-containing protein [Acidimicrobiia bacterium]